MAQRSSDGRKKVARDKESQKNGEATPRTIEEYCAVAIRAGVRTIESPPPGRDIFGKEYCC